MSCHKKLIRISAISAYRDFKIMSNMADTLVVGYRITADSVDYYLNDITSVAIKDGIVHICTKCCSYSFNISETGYSDESIKSIFVSDYMQDLTWSELLTLRDDSMLIAGQQYRITDYTCTTVQGDSRSEGNDFDIIVVADSVNKLNETARAIRRAGDTYFPNDTLFEAWELKYCIDNDTDRFAWADSVNGKGVIYYLKDEWNNEAAYDFKSITYCNLNTAGVDTYNNLPNDGSQYYYTFNLINTARNNGDYATCMSLDATIYNNVNVSNAPGQISGVHFCNFGAYKDENKRKLNKIVLFVVMEYGGGNYSVGIGDGCYNFLIGSRSKSIKGGNYCTSMTFGNSCYSMTFGNFCNTMTFGDGCRTLTYGDECYSMTFGDGCRTLTYGDYCNSMTFGNFCTSMTYGDECNTMTFGDGCKSMTFGNFCTSMTYGNFCYSMTYGDECNTMTFGEGCYSMTFGKACNNLTLPDNSTFGTINVLGAVTGGSGMDLADNDSTLFQTWLGAGNESNVIEIRQVKKNGAESTWKYIAQYIDVNGILQTKTKTGTSGTWV
jgi:hypothetical protein